MKFVYLALPLLGSLAIAQSLTEDNCQCPQVKCPSTDTFEGCRCVNLAELRCKRRCPNYTPAKFRICPLPQQPSTEPASSSPTPLATPSLPPILGFPTPALPLPEPAVPTSLADLPDLPLIPGCECEEMMCIQSFPDSCHCAYNIAKTCYDKCGGKSPGLNVCPPLDSLGGGFNFDGPVKRAAAPEPCPAPQKSTVPIPVNIPVNVPAPASALTAPLSTGSASASTSAKCECEETFCIQAFPASCVCANRNKNACWKKCGGPKPAYQICTNPIPNPVTSEKPSATSTKSIATSTRTTPSSTATSRPGLTQICGGGRANTNNCATGYTCIDDPYRVGVDGYCGLACDQTGICVQEQLCGGFAGFRCQTQGQICVDDPRDDCSPNTGGADCGGVCIWPVASRQLYTNNTQS